MSNTRGIHIAWSGRISGLLSSLVVAGALFGPVTGAAQDTFVPAYLPTLEVSKTTTPIAIDTTEALWPVARSLLHKADTTQQAVRLIGVAVSHFSESAQLSLFDSVQSNKKRRVADAVDAVKERFGADAISRAALLEENHYDQRPKKDAGTGGKRRPQRPGRREN